VIKISLGKFKGRIIKTLPSSGKDGYRPTTNKHRQLIFNILKHSSKLPEIDLMGANVADICCGSGALGFEALSLGADQAIFIDINSQVITNIKQTALQLGIAEKITTLQEDANKLSTAPFACDIVFVDPPYHQNIISSCLQGLIANGWLKDNHIIVLETAAHSPPIALDNFEILEEKLSGKTRLTFIIPLAK
jgi:16S rRNA (guanine966-N2)-methyltransferase